MNADVEERNEGPALASPGRPAWPGLSANGNGGNGEPDELAVEAWAKELNMAYEAVPDCDPSRELREILPARVALKHLLLPLRIQDGTLVIAMPDPFDGLAHQAAAMVCPRPIQWCLAPRAAIIERLRESYGVGAETFEEVIEQRQDDDSHAEVQQETTIVDEEDSEASVMKFVNQIFREALRQRATDIHIEPVADDLRIRYRIDGVLHAVPVPARIKVLQASVLSRIKIMAHLDIAERRLPQDGRINLEHEGSPIDVRVATIPSVMGESVSLRLLGQERFDFARLGVNGDLEAKIQALLAMPNGIVLLTGPTGCGKSTTLYTFLSQLNKPERRIVTIEDPVEHKIPGVVQIAVKPEIDLTFAAGLRCILRGDPNVIMVGEMRDFETAEIAIRAALTGHLVFSTLHTNDAIGGITRLVDMGVEPFLVSASVRAFIAQRLVRRLCADCKAPAEMSEAELAAVEFPLADRRKAMKAVGCGKCRNTGYQGRMAIYEICLISDAIQDAICQRQSGTLLKSVALREGMVPLRQYGWQKVAQGETTVEEVLRVTAADVNVRDGR
jgi:type II secretory ATPase GspE/PulE/Tfp pilus assembly ATPase PilB-like protein